MDAIVSLSAPTASPETRGHFGQLTGTVAGKPVETILREMSPALPETYAEFDKKSRGDAVSVDLYGYDAEQGVAVVQVRHAFRRYANGFMNVRKTYVLSGFNENGEPFRHPVGSHMVRAAINAGADAKGVVRAAQKWMWAVTDRQLDASQRQGDVLMVPERGLPKGDVEELGDRAVLGETHEVRAPKIVRVEGKKWLYAINPRLRHLKGQHEPLYTVEHDGWYSIRIAYEESAWDLSERLGD